MFTHKSYFRKQRGECDVVVSIEGVANMTGSPSKGGRDGVDRGILEVSGGGHPYVLAAEGGAGKKSSSIYSVSELPCSGNCKTYL